MWSAADLRVDSAFVDRADIVQYVDLPPREAIYEILGTCLRELVAKGIVSDVVSSFSPSLNTILGSKVLAL